LVDGVTGASIAGFKKGARRGFRAGGVVEAAYLRAAQAYMLISMPTGTSTIFGAFQATHLSQVYGANTPTVLKLRRPLGERKLGNRSTKLNRDYSAPYSVSCLWPHCLQANFTRVAPFSAKTRFGAPHLPQTVSIRVLPCFTTMAFLAMVSRISRSASSRIACFDIGPHLS
jgi:hypothetical protein